RRGSRRSASPAPGSGAARTRTPTQAVERARRPLRGGSTNMDSSDATLVGVRVRGVVGNTRAFQALVTGSNPVGRSQRPRALVRFSRSPSVRSSRYVFPTFGVCGRAGKLPVVNRVAPFQRGA